MTLPAADPKAASLSDAQRAYLRFVSQGLTSKQIAHAVGGSHHTINAEIGIAMRVLGAKSRQEAAATLLRLEEVASYERSYEPVRVAVPAPPVAQQASDGEGKSSPARPWPTDSRSENMLSAWPRIGWILGLAAAIALLLGGLVSGVAALLDGLSRWF
jgi:DNA-binding CsgD family transcriptional regulator